MEEKMFKMFINEIDYLTEMVTGIMTKERADKNASSDCGEIKDFTAIHSKRLTAISYREIEIESIVDNMRDDFTDVHKSVLWDSLKNLRDYIDACQSILGDFTLRKAMRQS